MADIWYYLFDKIIESYNPKNKFVCNTNFIQVWRISGQNKEFHHMWKNSIGFNPHLRKLGSLASPYYYGNKKSLWWARDVIV